MAARMLGIAVICVMVIAATADNTTADEKGRPMPFGKLADGTPVEMYTLTTAHGITAKLITYGAILTELHIPDKAGNTTDVVLGFDNLKGYLDGHPYFGAIVGRCANRIAKGKFTLDGKEYKLMTNNGPNHLHGGVKGFDTVVWKFAPPPGRAPGEKAPLIADNKAELDTDLKRAEVTFTYRSPDGEEGYPGNLDATVTYRLFSSFVGNQHVHTDLQIDYTAKTDKATPVNLTHHSYFNLAGPAAGDIHSHELEIAADKYTPVDDTMIPTGKIESVEGTPLDFRRPAIKTKRKTIGERIAQLKGDPGGYDHNYVVPPSKDALFGHDRIRKAAVVRDPKSGRVMEVWTSEPGLQFYSGNFLDGSLKGKGGVAYKKHQGFSLEAQHFPDSVNQPDFPTVILKPEQAYRQTTIYRFLAQ